MYCPYCRSVIADDAIFCSNCGKSVKPATTPPADSNVNQTYQAQRKALRNSELATLTSLLQHFSQKQAEYDLYDQTCEQLNRYARGTKSVPMVFGCILSALGLLCVFYFCQSFFSSGPEYLAKDFLNTDEGMTFLFGSLLLIPGIALIGLWIFNKTKNTRKKNYYQDQFSRLSAELHNHYYAYPNCPLGSEYTNPYILAHLKNMILSGRTDTIKESLNQLLADTNRTAVERYLKQIQNNTAAINRNIRFGNVFIASRFIK